MNLQMFVDLERSFRETCVRVHLPRKVDLDRSLVINLCVWAKEKLFYELVISAPVAPQVWHS